MVTRDEVVYAFRLLLGREPENESVIEQFRSAANWAALRELFLGSAEFRAKVNTKLSVDGSTDFINLPPNSVDVHVSDEHFHRLVAHVQLTWESLGREQPHWSVLTNPLFLSKNIDANASTFYESGESSVHLLERAAARAKKELRSDWTCFELGCGVGRVTAYLAQRFREVVAADISLPHLKLADEHMQSGGMKNVELLQLKSLATLQNMDPFDIFYSVIVLQHNPPPLIYRILQLVFAKVRTGGCVYFQLPVAYPNYSFSIREYLAEIERGKGAMEMHVLPQVDLFHLLDEHGLRILDLQRDNWTGTGFHSISILAEKLAVQ